MAHIIYPDYKEQLLRLASERMYATTATNATIGYQTIRYWGPNGPIDFNHNEPADLGAYKAVPVKLGSS